MSPTPLFVPAATARRRRRAGSGTALFAAFASTLSLLRWLLLGLVALYLGSGFTRVGPDEDALLFRLGRLQPNVAPPGLLFALPTPIDRVVKLSTRKQHEVSLFAWSPEESGASVPPVQTAAARVAHAATLAVLFPGSAPSARVPSGRGLHPAFDGSTLTGDVNLVQARFTVRYRIIQPRAFASATTPETVERLIEAACYAAATRVLAGLKIDAALGTGLEGLRLKVRELAQMRLDELGLGVELVAFEVNALTPPQATVSAFAEVTSAQVEARTTVEQAHTHRAQALPRAQGDAYRERQQAEADARQLQARAAGEAASFIALMSEHRAAPALVEARLRAETLEHILARARGKTLLPAADRALNLFLRDQK